MKKTHRLAVLLLALSALSSCNFRYIESEVEEEKNKDKTSSSLNTSQDSIDSTQEENNSLSQIINDIGDSITNLTTSIPVFDKSGIIVETTLYEDENICIVADELAYTDYSAVLYVTIENKTNLNISALAGTISYCCNSINGYMIEEGYMNCDIKPGKKAKDSINFSFQNLMLVGITEIADMEIGFNIHDDNMNTIFQGAVPLKTSLSNTHNYDKNYYYAAISDPASERNYNYTLTCFQSENLYDIGDVSITSKALMTRNNKNLLLLEAYNRGNNPITLSTSDIFINGIKCTSSVYSNYTINPHKTGLLSYIIDSIIDTKYWDFYGFKSIDSVRMTLTQKDSSWNKISLPEAINIQLSQNEYSIDTTGVKW